MTAAYRLPKTERNCSLTSTSGAGNRGGLYIRFPHVLGLIDGGAAAIDKVLNLCGSQEIGRQLRPLAGQALVGWLVGPAWAARKWYFKLTEL